MTYPIIVVCVIGVIVTVMMVVIVPIFKKLFASLGGKLPLPTRILITISNTLASWRVGLVILVVGVGASSCSCGGSRPKRAGGPGTGFKMRPPVFGPVTHKAGSEPVRRDAVLAALGRRAGHGGPRHHGQRVGERRSSPTPCSR